MSSASPLPSPHIAKAVAIEGAIHMPLSMARITALIRACGGHRELANRAGDSDYEESVAFF